MDFTSASISRKKTSPSHSNNVESQYRAALIEFETLIKASSSADAVSPSASWHRDEKRQSRNSRTKGALASLVKLALYKILGRGRDLSTMVERHWIRMPDTAGDL